MIAARRIDADIAPQAPFSGGYEAGGQVAAMQAEIAARLQAVGIVAAEVQPIAEPAGAMAIRRFSTAAGYAALSFGYLVAGVAIYRFALA